jgi:predicted nucleic acid-binding protein
MTTVVVDASVVLKWILPSRFDEPHSEEALDILRGIQSARLEALQPPHWLAEAGAVLARLAPELSEEAIGLLYSFEFPAAADIAVYRHAVRMATSLREHVFDTLYHAVALQQPNAVLVTADERYYRKASGLGRIVRLREFTWQRV